MNSIDGDVFPNRLYSLQINLEVDEHGERFYVARHPELPGCLAQGSTPEEATSSLEEVREMVLRHLLAHGMPIPEPGELVPQAVTPLVIRDLEERSAVGTRKYGRPLSTFNGRQALQDAYEEALDLAQYLKQALMEQEQERSS